MSNTDIEIVVEDPTAPEANSPAVTSIRADVVVCLLLFALALGYDNWRTGAGWKSTRTALARAASRACTAVRRTQGFRLGSDRVHVSWQCRRPVPAAT
jgi:hypothetical protein